MTAAGGIRAMKANPNRHTSCTFLFLMPDDEVENTGEDCCCDGNSCYVFHVISRPPYLWE